MGTDLWFNSKTLLQTCLVKPGRIAPLFCRQKFLSSRKENVLGVSFGSQSSGNPKDWKPLFHDLCFATELSFDKPINTA